MIWKIIRPPSSTLCAGLETRTVDNGPMFQIADQNLRVAGSRDSHQDDPRTLERHVVVAGVVVVTGCSCSDHRKRRQRNSEMELNSI